MIYLARNKLVAILLTLVFSTKIIAGTQINANGKGGVAIGNLTLNTINLDISESDLKLLFIANEKQRNQPITALINKLSSKVQQDAYTLGTVQMFLMIIKGQLVPRNKFEETLKEVAVRYLDLENQIKNIPITSEKIKFLVNEAEIQRKNGQFEQVDLLLKQAAEQSLYELKKARANTKQWEDQLAQIKSTQASSMLQLNRSNRFNELELAAKLYEEAYYLKKENPTVTSIWWLISASDAYTANSNFKLAESTLKEINIVCAKQADLQKLDLEWQRCLSISHMKLGYLLEKNEGWLKALGHFEIARQISEKLLKIDENNLRFQQDLSIIYELIGYAKLQINELDLAFNSYQKTKQIRQKLIIKDDQNIQWLMDLSKTYESIGYIKLQMGELDSSFENYQASKQLRQKLINKDGANTLWLQDLSKTHEAIGYVKLQAGELNLAVENYESAKLLRQRLVSKDGENIRELQSLIVNLQSIVYILKLKNDFVEALEYYRIIKEIQEKIVSKDSYDMQWQYDLSVTQENIANLLLGVGDTKQAFKYYRDAMYISEKIAIKNPENINLQLDLARHYFLIGVFRDEQDSVNSYKLWLQKALSILENLEQQNRLNQKQKDFQNLIKKALKNE